MKNVKCHLNALESKVKDSCLNLEINSLVKFEFKVVANNVDDFCSDFFLYLQDGVDAIFVNAILTSIQQRNLEASLLN